MKRKHILLSFFLVILLFVSAGCTGNTSENTDMVITDGGWTVLDDGTFSFAFIIENNYESPLNADNIRIDAFDSDGSIIATEDGYAGTFPSGNLRPGEKTAIVWSSEDSGLSWTDPPASFEAGIKHISRGDDNLPFITITDSVPEYFNEFGGATYNVTLRNEGKEDFLWSLNDPMNDQALMIAAVARNSEGKITGGGYAYPLRADGDLLNEDILIPAGEEVSVRLYAQLNTAGEYEFYTKWN